MKKFHFIGVCLLILSACSSQPTPPPAPTSLPSPTEQEMASTAAPTVTDVSQPPTAQSTPTVGTPTVCVDSAESVEWLRDDMPYNFVEVTQNKPVPPNGYFTMTFTLRNSGTCTWDSSYAITFESGYRMSQQEKYPVIAEGETVAPGGTITIHIVMVAPPKTGGHQGIWQLQSRDGVLLKLNVFVKVDKGTYSPPARPVQLTYKDVCEDGFAKVRLYWVDAADNEDGYRIYRNSRLLVQLPANADSVLDAILGGEGKYTYTVVAFNAAGEGSEILIADLAPCK